MLDFSPYRPFLIKVLLRKQAIRSNEYRQILPNLSALYTKIKNAAGLIEEGQVIDS
jgi:hypothetical protein